MKLGKSLALAAIGLGMSFSQLSANEPADKKNATQPVKGTELAPVSELKEGISPEKVMEYRNSFRSRDLVINGDVGTYSFSNVPEFYQTATVYRGAGQVSMLEEALDKNLLNTSTDTEVGKMPLKDLLLNDQARMQGVLVIHDGKVVLEEYPGMNDLEKHTWWSASKQLVGVLVYLLEEEGLIDIEKSVNHYLPDFEGEDWKKVKVKHLLHHVSGMDYVETNENIMNPTHPIAKAAKYSMATRHEEGGQSMMEIIKDVKSYMEPGVQFDYSIMNTQTLGYIIERVTGKKVEDVVSERIWNTTGMESEGHYALTSFGEPVTGGYFASRLRDLGRFGMLYTDSWNKVANKQIIADSYFEKVYDTEFSDAFLKGAQGQTMKKAFDDTPSHATYQWDAVFEDGDMFKAGRYGQGIYVSPETNTVVVWFSSTYMNQTYIPGFARQIIQQNFR
nr:serine hydrolase domain-containing protein [uncultured Carboxylicivirga sp.]